MMIQPFRAIRPEPSLASQVSCLPYDVMDRSEAYQMAQNAPHSFLHVIRSEIDLGETVDPYDVAVYQQAKHRFQQMQQNGVLVKESRPAFYLYRQTMNQRSQLGLVGCFHIDDYLNGKIKKHELTRPEKELDRIHHFDACNAHTEPVFLTHRSNQLLGQWMTNWVDLHAPLYDFVSEDEVRHEFWAITDPGKISQIQQLFSEQVSHVYIADGHHRTASSVKIGLKRREERPEMQVEEDPSQYLMAVTFPEEDLMIMEYNRVVADLNNLSTSRFLELIQQHFDCVATDEQVRPERKHTFGMLLDGQWYQLEARPHTFDESDVISQLDVTILQNWLLDPILGIHDPRTDHRIDFVGGIRGIEALEQRTRKDMRIGFSLFPTTIEDLLWVADENRIMPPKSTWFEPKLRSGLFIHSLDPADH